MIASYDVPEPSYASLTVKIDSQEYQMFYENGSPRKYDEELADMYPREFIKITDESVDNVKTIAVLTAAQDLFDAHRRHFNQTIPEEIESDLRKGGVRKAFMVWATGDIHAEIPRLPRPWDYKIKMSLPKLVKRS